MFVVLYESDSAFLFVFCKCIVFALIVGNDWIYHQDVWPEQTKIDMPVPVGRGSTSLPRKYRQGLNDSYFVLQLNVPKVMIDVILSYLDESRTPRLHLMSSTHYIQININYLIHQYWNGVKYLNNRDWLR